MSAKVLSKITIRNPPIIFDTDKEMDDFKKKIASTFSLNPNLIEFTFKEVQRVHQVFKGGL